MPHASSLWLYNEQSSTPYTERYVNNIGDEFETFAGIIEVWVFEV